jgi:capsule polysaccharide modification protein KpsS
VRERGFSLLVEPAQGRRTAHYNADDDLENYARAALLQQAVCSVLMYEQTCIDHETMAVVASHTQRAFVYEAPSCQCLISLVQHS